jgi:hypothetical protein
MEYSNKIILVTENSRIATPIRHALNKHGLEIESEYLNLHALPVIRKGIARTGRTTFIRNELIRYIRERGFPAAVIMDAQVNLGFPTENDPGMIKLLKTLLISYIIFSKGRDYGKVQGSFLLLTKGKSFGERFGMATDPSRILEQLATENPAINGYIDELKKDRARFESLFFIRLFDSEVASNAVTDFVDTFLKGVNVRRGGAAPEGSAAAEGATDASEASEPEAAAAEDTAPARVVYRIDGENIYDDGHLVPASSDEYAGMREREFYLIGSWTSNTELEVSRKIAGVIQKGIGGEKRFSFNDAIVFNIDDRCAIDKNTTLSIAQLFTKNLAAYKKISLSFSDRHLKLVEKSRGYPMLKDLIAGQPVA